MKSILDSSFKYRPSFETDVRKTFERIRREQAQRRHAGKAAAPDVPIKVVTLERPGSAAGGSAGRASL